jgi:small conductance mechanosensitive channel
VIAAGLADRWWWVPMRLATIVVAAVVITAVARRLVRRAVKRVPDILKDEDRSQQRFKTVASVLTSAVAVIVWVVAVVSILDEVGVNVGGFVAVGGLIGGGLAFGAQNLVRDFLAGMFVLLEDQYGVGDVVDLGVAQGTVERVSLRATRLRDADGRVWHVPNGQVVRVGNLSQEWAQAIVDVPIDREVEPSEAMALISGVTSDVAAGPLADKVLDTPKLLGVESFADDRFVVRVTVKTQPAAQWEVMRALRVELLRALSRAQMLPARAFVAGSAHRPDPPPTGRS